jgi:hypothetical protein
MSNQIVMSAPNGSPVEEQVALVTLYVRHSEGKLNAARSAPWPAVSVRNTGNPEDTIERM